MDVVVVVDGGPFSDTKTNSYLQVFSFSSSSSSSLCLSRYNKIKLHISFNSYHEFIIIELFLSFRTLGASLVIVCKGDEEEFDVFHHFRLSLWV